MNERAGAFGFPPFFYSALRSPPIVCLNSPLKKCDTGKHPFFKRAIKRTCCPKRWTCAHR
jgi:hypothetical protein